MSEMAYRKSYDYDTARDRVKSTQNDYGHKYPTINNPFRHAGEYYDTERGNIYLRARYYNTANGRFITADPTKYGINWYNYCKGNPIMFLAPTGLEYVEVQEFW